MSAATAPTSPASASSTAFATYRLASPTLSCALPCLRFPTPSTSSSGFRVIHFRFPQHHLRNDFDSARMFRWLSADVGPQAHGASG